MADDLSLRLARESADGTLNTVSGPLVPNVPSTRTKDVAAVIKALDALKQISDVREGRSGSAMDKHLTLRELVDSGVLTLSIGGQKIIGGTGSLVGGTGDTTVVISSGTGGTVGYVDPRPVLTTPPTITGLTANGAFKNIILVWVMTDYRNRAYVEVWRSTSNALGTATIIGTSTADMYTDGSGTAGATYYYWVRAVNLESAVGAYNAVGGVSASMGPDISIMLSQLTGQITTSQLFSTLNTRINLIDGPSGTAGTVDYRIAAASTTLTSDYAAADAVGYTNAQTYVATYAYSKSTVDSSFTSQFSSLTANYTTADAIGYANAQTYVATYAYAKATVDASFASQFNLLTTNYQNADTIISASVSTEALARASADGSLFAQYTVKIDTNGYVSGYGLASTSTGAAPTSSFIVKSDSFAVASPSGPGITPVVPFITRTTPTTINGVTVPVGVYMDAAYIQNGSITNAKIGNATIDDAKIANLDAGKVTFGTMSGDRITANSMHATSIVANDIGVGQINATLLNTDNVLTRGLTVRDNSGNVILASGTNLDWSKISGTGKAADNATVGATFGTNISGQITSANASTYIASAAIGDAQIGNLNANKITAGLIQTAQIQVGAASVAVSAITSGLGATFSSVSSSTSSANIVSLTSTGSRVTLNASISLNAVFSATAPHHIAFICDVYMDGGQVWTLSSSSNKCYILTTRTLSILGGEQSANFTVPVLVSSVLSAASHTWSCTVTIKSYDSSGALLNCSGNWVVDITAIAQENKV